MYAPISKVTHFKYVNVLKRASGLSKVSKNFYLYKIYSKSPWSVKYNSFPCCFSCDLRLTSNIMDGDVSTCDSSPVSNVESKREDYLDWCDYFMSVAFLAAKRSKDPCTQVGACIVNDDKKIVGVGYNGMPIGCSDDEFPWGKKDRFGLDNKYLYVCHAEMNAILNKNSSDVRNCTIYVALFPCNECAKIITQSGIKEVVYMSDKNAHKVETIASKRMFDAAGIKYRQHKPKSKKIVIDFGEIEWSQERTPVKSNKNPL